MMIYNTKLLAMVGIEISYIPPGLRAGITVREWLRLYFRKIFRVLR